MNQILKTQDMKQSESRTNPIKYAELSVPNRTLGKVNNSTRLHKDTVQNMHFTLVSCYKNARKLDPSFNTGCKELGLPTVLPCVNGTQIKESGRARNKE